MVDSQAYVKNVSGLYHLPDCSHLPRGDRQRARNTPVSREAAIEAWRAAPDVTMGPERREGWCENCVARRMRDDSLSRRAWLVRGSNVNGQDLVPSWLAQGQISVSASSLRQVEPGISREELKPIVDADYSHASYNVKGEKLDEFHAFLSRMDVDHLVMTLDKGVAYLGEIAGEAHFGQLDEASTPSAILREVSWKREGVAVDDLPAELKARLKAQYDVLDLTQHLEVIESLIPDDDPKVPQPPVAELEPLADPPQELAESLHVPLAWLSECVELLRDRPQMVFYGPPGTGKTYLSQKIAQHLAGENVRLVQFHPAYSYEDFFEGYRPTAEGGFELKPGPMRKIADQAVQNPSTWHVLIVDEINRGNLAKVFGELYFLLEYREENVELLYGDGVFSLPPNVIIIGTMNTADRSIALVDAAMRRRFAFVPLHPSESPTSEILRAWLAATERPAEVADLMDELNAQIDDVDFKIGPSYFMRKAVYTDGGLARVWRTSILPLLEEHHYGELTAVQVADRYGLEAIEARVGRADAGAD